MTVRLINTTTRLPADKRLEDELISVMAPELKCALWDLYVPFWPEDAPIDIFLVNRLENKHDNEEEETDFLGVYFPHHRKYCRPAIQVCPEKIMHAAKELCDKTTPKVMLTRAYPALFCMVVIHELAHALMDNFRTRSREYEPWHFLASRFDQATSDVDYFEQALPANGHAGGSCKHSIYFTKSQFSDTAKMRHVIEESLANAIALQQNYRFGEQDFIKKFVSLQSPSYNAGLKWGQPLSDLLSTASNWSAWKDSIFESEIKYDYQKACSPKKPCLIHRLLDKSMPPETQSFLKEDFKDEFRKHEK